MCATQDWNQDTDGRRQRRIFAASLEDAHFIDRAGAVHIPGIPDRDEKTVSSIPIGADIPRAFRNGGIAAQGAFEAHATPFKPGQSHKCSTPETMKYTDAPSMTAAMESITNAAASGIVDSYGRFLSFIIPAG